MTRDRRLQIALVLNLAIVVAQAISGWIGHSLGLLADAGHNLTDVAALGLALMAVRWARRPPTDRRSYGYHRGTILSAQANAAAIVAITALVFAYSLANTFLVESIFDWPGLGSYVVASTQTLDTPAIIGVTLLIAIVYVVSNLLVDVAQALLDPRIRLE